MSFRFILWGSNSQTENLTDMFTQQAEAEFRSTFKAEFDDVIPQSAQTQSAPKTSANNTEQTALSNATDAVSGLVQTVADNIDAKSSPAEISEVVQTTTDTLTKTGKELSENTLAADQNTISNTSDKISQNTVSNTSDKISQIKEANELVASIDATSESLKEVSKSLNENPAVTPNNNASTEKPQNEALNDLIKKMKDFLTEIKEKALSLIKALRQPQLEYFYGAEDTIEDYGKKELLSIEDANKQKNFEDLIIKKMLERENDKTALKKQTKLKDKLAEATVVKLKQTDLEKVLAMKLEETRNKNLFGR